MPEVVIDLAWPCLAMPARTCPHPPKKDRPVAPTRPNGFVNHVAMVAKKILILRAEARMDSFFNLLPGFIFQDSGAGIQVPIKAAPSIPSIHRSQNTQYTLETLLNFAGTSALASILTSKAPVSQKKRPFLVIFGRFPRMIPAEGSFCRF